MAMVNCWECGKPVSDSAISCPHCGAASTVPAGVTPAIPVQGEEKKSRSSWWMWLVGVPVALFLLLLAFGASMSPEEKAKYDRKAAVDRACEEMISDSALGNERRMTRRMCDDAKRLLDQR